MRLGLSIFFIVVSAKFIFAQNQKETSWVAGAIDNAVQEYKNEFKESVLLYSGGEYVDYDLRVEGFPYFLEDYFVVGWVILDGRLYENVQLKYDVHKDILVIEHYDGRGYMQELELISGKVDSFNVHGYDFFRIEEKGKYGTQLDPGFYNLLYKGNTVVVSKRYKAYEETIDGLKLLKNFILKDRFFVIKDNQIYPIKKKNSVYRVFKDKKKELKKALRERNVNFKYNFEEAVNSAAEIYDKLVDEQ